MKKARKLTAVLLSLVMLLALAAPALAVDPTYTITINNEQTGHTYEAYQVFAGTVSSDDLQTFDPDNPDAVASDGPMLGDVVWGSGVKAEQQANLLTALKADATLAGLPGMDTAATAADVAKAMDGATAEAAAAFAAVVATRTADGYTYLSGTKTESTVTDPFNDQYTITGLAAGYYLVMDQNGSLQGDTATATDYIVQVLGNVTMVPKDTDIPTLEKKVYDDEYANDRDADHSYESGYNDVADWGIDDRVPFKLVGSIPDMTDYDTYQYIFHDTLSTGLTLDPESIRIYIAHDTDEDPNGPDGGGNIWTPASEELYEVAIGENGNFTITIPDLKKVPFATDADRHYVYVLYDAILNENAVIGQPGNPNTAYLEFSNDPNGDGTGRTEEDTVIVFTYELDGTKVDGQDINTKLEGAQFVLLNGGGTRVADIEDGQFKGWLEPDDIDPTVEGNNDVARVNALTYEDYANYQGGKLLITSDTDGLFKVAGVQDGKYLLREVQAPAGYNKLENDVELTLNATTYNGHEWDEDPASAFTALTLTVTGNDPVNGGTDGVVEITVENNRGATLPETGGMGTTLFYIIGGLLVVGAAVLLVVRLRMKASNE